MVIYKQCIYPSVWLTFRIWYCYYFATHYMFRVLSNLLAIPHMFSSPDSEKSDSVCVTVLNLSPHSKNFCQLMTPNLPQPYVLGQFSDFTQGGFSMGVYSLIFIKMTPGPWPTWWDPLEPPDPLTGITTWAWQGSQPTFLFKLNDFGLPNYWSWCTSHRRHF